jgi:glycosyltransferase involved in cell wall biosynthesis
MRLRIAILGLTYPYRGGISHYTTVLSKALSARHEVQVFSYLRQYPSFLFPGTTQFDASDRRIEVPARHVLDSIGPMSWVRTARAIEKYSPDLLIIQWWQPFFGAAVGTVCRVLQGPCTVLFLCHNVVPHERSRVDGWLSNYALSKGDLFVVHSGEDLANLKDLLPGADAVVRPHPTYEVFRGLGEGARQTSERSAERQILFFGYVRKYKGLEYLLRAMPEVLGELDVTLRAVGEFYDDVSHYRRLVSELGIERSVRLVDRYVPNEDVGGYFSQTDLVVLPYVTATQSGIIQIAYSFGVPVVTTNVGGLPDVVDDGRTGYLVEPKDPSAIAQAILRYYREREEKDFRSTIADYARRFSWESMVDEIERLYHSSVSTAETRLRSASPRQAPSTPRTPF